MNSLEIKEIIDKLGVVFIVTDEDGNLVYSNHKEGQKILALLRYGKEKLLDPSNIVIERKIFISNIPYNVFMLVPVDTNASCIVSDDILNGFPRARIYGNIFLRKAKEAILILLNPKDLKLKKTVDDASRSIRENFSDLVHVEIVENKYAILIAIGNIEETYVILNEVEAMLLSLCGSQSDVPCEIGIALYPEDGGTFEELLDKASKNIVESGSVIELINLKSVIEKHNLIVHAFKNNLFKILVQPYFSSWNLDVRGGECLVRIVDAEKNKIYGPNLFIDYLENSHFLLDFETWLVDEAFKLLKDIDKHVKTPKSISINLTVRNLMNPNFFDVVLDELLSLKLEKCYLVIEIPERSIIHEHIISRLSEIVSMLSAKNIPLKIAIDDFGTGYTSLKTIAAGIVNKIKVDKILVKDVETSYYKVGTMLGITTVSKRCGLETVAEGVEKKSELDTLRVLGVDYIQGYLLSKPISVDEFKLLLTGG